MDRRDLCSTDGERWEIRKKNEKRGVKMKIKVYLCFDGGESMVGHVSLAGREWRM